MADNNPEGGVSIDVFVMEEKLDKIRSQVASKLDNQKNLALILSAVEENIDEQGNDKTPVAYFVSFLALLEQSVGEEQVLDVKVAAAAAYFLDLVLPFIPAALLKQKFGHILTRLAPVLTSSAAEPALIRSSIGSLESLLMAQDNQQWSSLSNVSPKRALIGMLELSFDPRPKVRKRAQEAVHKILTNPPPSPLPTHIAAGLCGELSLKKLVSLVQTQLKSKKHANKEANSQIIHVLQLISAITLANAWPPAQVEALCDVLLDVTRTSDQYLVGAAFSAFDGLFSSMSNDVDVEKFTRVLDIIFELKPPSDDSHLAASWLAVVANGVQSFAKLLPETSLAKVTSVIPIVAEFLASESKDIYVSASQCLIAIISESIPDEFLLQPTRENGVPVKIYEEVDELITYIAEFIEKELLSIKYQHATKETLDLITATILKFRKRSNPDFLNILETVGQWRSNEEANFPYNKEAEDAIAACISTMGPEVVLDSLPLNLTGSKAGQPGRAWLLPILRDNVRFASLEYYKRNILSLVSFFEEKIQAAGNKESMHVKIFQTIVDQIWSLLPHFADLPRDLISAFSDEFAANLADLLYSKVELRVTVCHALRLLVESNLAYSQGALADDLMIQEDLTIAESEKNLAYLASKASNVLSVLFNVFSSTMPESRGFVLETIDTYLQIIPDSDLEITFNKVCGLLKKAMDDEAGEKQPTKKDQPPKLSVTMMDLVVAMAKYVPSSSYNALLLIFSSTVNLQNDALMQKRAYRIITKLDESESGQQVISQFITELQNVFVQNIGSTHTSARASRLGALEVVIKLLPQSDLHFIPAILQEVIMSTKDVNERSREASYSLLIQIGNKMSQGGVIDNSKVPGFDPATPPSEASLTEYFTMVSAGLAAQSQHMISATITAISCLVYEFKDQMPQDLLIEIASTVELFLTHNSREIAKSAIGFVKVEVLSLPEELVRANLKELLAKLMKWSHEHKGHFKSKVKHILERLIRKFGIEAVEQAIPEEDKKLVANIKKSRARAKRKEAEAEKDENKEGKKFMSAYEEAVYDSDSDGSDNEEEVKTKRGKAANKYILDNGDEPLNLLDRQTLAHISSSKPKKFTKSDLKQEKLQMRNGKIVVNEDDANPLGAASGIDAYLDAVKQAPVRGQKNKLKFKKSKEDDWSDDEEETRKRPTKVDKRLRVLKPKQKFKARKKL